MTDWPDHKIRSTALFYIEKTLMDRSSWRWSLIGEAHEGLSERVEFQPGELPVVSFFLSELSWYLLSTRRIVGSYAGQKCDVAVLDVLEGRFPNFKGYGDKYTEVMTLHISDGRDVKLEYETGAASMAPIYYFRYWKIKFPILDKLIE